MKTAKYIGIHNISAKTTNKRLPRSISDSNSCAYESNDLLCFLILIKHPREEGADIKVVTVLLCLSAKSLSPFLSLL